MTDLIVGLGLGFVMGFSFCCIILNKNKWPEKKKESDLPTACVDCTSCEHYAESRTFERLNSDKTLTPSELEKRWCTFQYNGHFELTDLTPCPKYKARRNYLPVKRQMNITPPPPIPPRKK